MDGLIWNEWRNFSLNAHRAQILYVRAARFTSPCGSLQSAGVHK